MSNIRKTSDDFVWLIVNDKAKEIFNSGLFELYAVFPDGSEALIEDHEDLEWKREIGIDIAIEVGKV